MNADWRALLPGRPTALRPARIHLVGIGGTGLSAIAKVLHEMGCAVSGCDRAPSAALAALQQLGVRVAVGHAAEHAADADVVLVSSAIPEDNPDIAGARARGVPVVKRADFLGALMEGRRGIAVAGSHGKTTTTGMIAWLLQGLGLAPSYIVGAPLRDLGTNARAGTGDWFVIEADEYDRMFLGLRPEVAVVTNIEWDHPDCYPTEAAFREAFLRFAEAVPQSGLLLACSDDAGVRWLKNQCPSRATWWSYGRNDDALWQATAIRNNNRGGMDFRLLRAGAVWADVQLAVPGTHNVLNATAALAVAACAGAAPHEAARILSGFHGATRRLEVLGESPNRGIIVFDDYGHHPTEIRMTLAALRSRYPQRPLWAVWQPHTFSRTRALLADFASAFADADHVVVTDIFASREADDGSVHASDVVQQMRHPDARHIGPLDDAAAYLLAHMAAGSVMVTFSAGDGNRVGQMVLAALQAAEKG